MKVEDRFRLKELRGRRRQSYIAEQAGISQSLYSGLERGTKELTLLTAERLETLLGEEVLGMVPPEHHHPGYLTSSEAGATLDPVHSDDDMRRLCANERIPGAKKEFFKGKSRWLIPVGFEILYGARWGVISERRKNNIARAYIDKKKNSVQLAKEYGVHQSYPAKLVERGYPNMVSA